MTSGACGLLQTGDTTLFFQGSCTREDRNKDPKLHLINCMTIAAGWLRKPCTRTMCAHSSFIIMRASFRSFASAAALLQSPLIFFSATGRPCHFPTHSSPKLEVAARMRALHCTSHGAMTTSFRLLSVSSRLLRLTAITTLSISATNALCNSSTWY